MSIWTKTCLIPLSQTMHGSVLWEQSEPRMPSFLMALLLSTTLVLPCRRVLISAHLTLNRTSLRFGRLALRLLVVSLTTSPVDLAGSVQDQPVRLGTHLAAPSTRAQRPLGILRRQAILLPHLAWELPVLVSSRRPGFLPPARLSPPHRLLTRQHRRHMGKPPRRLRRTLQRRLGSRPRRPITAQRRQASVRHPLPLALRHPATVQQVPPLGVLGDSSLPLHPPLPSTRPLLLAGLPRVLSSTRRPRQTLLARRHRLEGQPLQVTALPRQHTALREFFWLP